MHLLVAHLYWKQQIHNPARLTGQSPGTRNGISWGLLPQNTARPNHPQPASSPGQQPRLPVPTLGAQRALHLIPSIPSLYQLISAKPETHSDLLHILCKPSTQLTICFAKEFGFVERQKRPAQFCWHSRGSRNSVTLTVAAVSVLVFTVLHPTPSPRHLKEAKHTRPALISRRELSHRPKAETVPALCRGPGNKHLLCMKFSVRTKIWNCLF